ncbi:MAG: hypothetical protein FD143_1710 [Ignavibacteria bacterium]|nr:MAG: hypothetical protein FD143_1710 [Ignavibacteria bacterium]KAF0160058.1 MAG: hypothetical protein FD188_1872 [Ignavibacteria bacterium]
MKTIKNKKSLLAKCADLATRQFFLHTVLVCLLHILIVFRTIKESGYPFSNVEIILSIILMCVIALLSFFLSKYLLKDKVKAAVVATLFLGVSFSYGFVGKNLFQLNSFASLADKLFFGNYVLASVTMLSFTFVLISYIISIIPFKLIRFSNYLNALLILLLFFEINNHFSYKPKTIKLEDEIKIPLNSVKADSTFPNIYYIVLDSYTSIESLKKYWKYDNIELINFLKERGFYLASKSKSNYNQTHFTIASAMNLSYLHYASFDKLTFAHYPNLYRLIKDNVLVRVLENYGYETINFSLFNISNTSKYYRFDLADEPRLFKNTLFEGIVNATEVGSMLGLSSAPETDIIKTTTGITNLLKDTSLKRFSRSIFVYAHFMLPHPPYYFDASGNIMPDNYAKDDYNKWKYLEQLKYSNKLIMEVINFILTNSSVKPVIIIQGDHGFRFLTDKTAQHDESHAILNAFYFPDGDYKMLYPTISSVNTFRILLNKFNFLDINALHDQTFFVAKGIGFN